MSSLVRLKPCYLHCQMLETLFNKIKNNIKKGVSFLIGVTYETIKILAACSFKSEYWKIILDKWAYKFNRISMTTQAATLNYK